MPEITICLCVNRSAERPTGDLRERMKNKRQDVESDATKRDPEEPTSPTARVSYSPHTHLAFMSGFLLFFRT